MLKGGVHGFRFYEVSVGEKFLECVLVGGDLGYVGVLRLHKNSCIPNTTTDRVWNVLFMCVEQLFF
jgi:hypothetical protein